MIHIDDVDDSYLVNYGNVLYAVDVADLHHERYKHRLETSHKETGSIHVKVKLPAGVTCSRCGLQWTWITGNTWGTCSTGYQAVGCGPQETFRNCADIKIVKRGGQHDNQAQHRETLFQMNKFGDLEPVSVEWSVCVARNSSYTDHQCMKDCFRYPPACDLSLCQCYSRCESVGTFSLLPDSDTWCNMNCLQHPSHCPEKKCRCS